MQIYVSATSLTATIHKRKPALHELPSFVTQYGFEGLELSERRILNCGSRHVQSLAQAAEKANCGLIIDIDCDLTQSDQKSAEKEIEHVTETLHLCREIGAKCARICLGGQRLSMQRLRARRYNSHRKREVEEPTPKVENANLKILVLNKLALNAAHFLRKHLKSHVRNLEAKKANAVASLQKILPQAMKTEIPLAIENHWGISSRPEHIRTICEEINSPWLGTCPDFGNFPRGVDVCEGLSILASQAVHAHAKSYGFDGNGEERGINYKQCLAILKRAGYKGNFTVEYEGWGDDLKGCLRTKDLILKHW